MRQVGIEIDLYAFQPRILSLKQDDTTCLAITINEHGAPKDLTDCDFTLNVKLPNDDVYIQSNFTATGNIASVTLNATVVALAGNAIFELKIYKNNVFESSFVFAAIVEAATLPNTSEVESIAGTTVIAELNAKILEALNTKAILLNADAQARGSILSIIETNESMNVAESARTLAESGRDNAEALRASAEIVRETEEVGRKKSESARADAEEKRRAAEAVRQSAEESREINEELRAANYLHGTRNNQNPAVMSDVAKHSAFDSVTIIGKTTTEGDYTPGATPPAARVIVPVSDPYITMTDGAALLEEIVLNGITLNGVNSVADTIDYAAGSWALTQRCARYVCDGELTENNIEFVSQMDSGTQIRTKLANVLAQDGNSGESGYRYAGVCNYLEYSYLAGGTNTSNVICANMRNLWLHCPISWGMSKAEIAATINALSPALEVVYALKTPLTTPITDASMLAELNKLISPFAPKTIITITPEAARANIEYTRDITITINNIEAMIAEGEGV